MPPSPISPALVMPLVFDKIFKVGEWANFVLHLLIRIHFLQLQQCKTINVEKMDFFLRKFWKEKVKIHHKNGISDYFAFDHVTLSSGY